MSYVMVLKYLLLKNGCEISDTELGVPTQNLVLTCYSFLSESEISSLTGLGGMDVTNRQMPDIVEFGSRGGPGLGSGKPSLR